MKYYAYTRVSTETQAEHGGGLEVQRQNIEKYAADNGIELAHLFTDAGISGAIGDTEAGDAINKRPALIEMLSTLQEGDAVIVLNTSRLWRSDTAKVIIRREFLKKNVRVISIEQPGYDVNAANPNDRFMAGIMELMDEWERLTIALKLAKGRTAKAKNGDKPAGVCPYGYSYSTDKKSVVIVDEEAQLVRRMFTLGQTGSSLTKIAAEINKTGMKTRHGREWSKGTIQAILRNRFYIGELTHAGQVIQGNHTPIISRVQFGKVGAQLERRKRG